MFFIAGDWNSPTGQWLNLIGFSVTINAIGCYQLIIECIDTNAEWFAQVILDYAFYELDPINIKVIFCVYWLYLINWTDNSTEMDFVLN